VFIKCFKNGFQTSIDYVSHTKFLATVGKSTEFSLLNFDISKTLFVLDKFKSEFLIKIKNYKDTLNSTRSHLLKTNVDKFYQLSKNSKINGGYFVCLTADLLTEPSLLKIMLEFGLLNFNF
jgi:hypothetical protein